MLTVKGRYYQPSIALDVFRFLRAFGHEDHHPSIQVYLQLLKHHLNDLHLDQLIHLAHMTQKITNNKNAQLIFHGIQALVPKRANEFGSLSFYQMLLVLDIFSAELIDRHQDYFLLKIESHLNEYKLSPVHSICLLQALSKLSVQSTVLEERCVAVIEKYLAKFSVSDLTAIVSNLVTLNLYCPELLNDIGDWFCDKSTNSDENQGVDFSDKLDLLCDFSRQSHVHPGLLRDAIQHVQSTGGTHLSLTSLLKLAELITMTRDIPHATRHYFVTAFTDALNTDDISEIWTLGKQHINK